MPHDEFILAENRGASYECGYGAILRRNYSGLGGMAFGVSGIYPISTIVMICSRFDFIMSYMNSCHLLMM